MVSRLSSDRGTRVLSLQWLVTGTDMKIDWEPVRKQEKDSVRRTFEVQSCQELCSGAPRQ